ncbi:MAG TPA: MOSC N-terminal beta barrel domain-containing protein [Opitutus sp.]|nr:MOSC N-terminal beta barrel domain-containing protein [Opitutus sp.]
MHLSGLFIYPVKSLAGISLNTAEIDAAGLVHDRRFMVIDDNDRFLTQRTLPRMALIATELTPADLVLRAPAQSACMVPLIATTTPIKRSVSIWKSAGLIAEDCGDEPAQWLSSFLRATCRLVRIGKDFHRPVQNLKKARFGDVVAFADGYPFLAIGESSLADLNDRLAESGEEAVPMNRFRPNLVISGSSPFAEDSWQRFQIGSVTFRAAGPSERCVITTTDQSTAERGREPLRTLATYRRSHSDNTAILFGQNFIHESKFGTLRLGDPVTIVE